MCIIIIVIITININIKILMVTLDLLQPSRLLISTFMILTRWIICEFLSRDHQHHNYDQAHTI